ncbi:MAG TPA: hemerythrin domain-containing protein [Holophagaceae bacterium]|nr:hemerythrin domain-containing protein [Holophagaceae bacterium]
MGTETFLNQHREIRNLLKGLHDQLDPASLRRDPAPAFHQVRRLGGYLRQHFQGERPELYDRLAASRNAHVAALALCAEKDLCGLEPKVSDFVRVWCGAGRIQRDAEGFIREATALIAAVGRRIGQEERELFPLLKRAG